MGDCMYSRRASQDEGVKSNFGASQSQDVRVKANSACGLDLSQVSWDGTVKSGFVSEAGGDAMNLRQASQDGSTKNSFIGAVGARECMGNPVHSMRPPAGIDGGTTTGMQSIKFGDKILQFFS
ncbi:unnamed protein product [Gongylonema pulchrum]|uniref:Uncharacterized protein n=1 Tax=Gongylonema pulchrum TaxID=637853 RepID=A0A3P6REF1_9BILA|nr:unnamed protein product [Gongylonema pulchrum]